jgi:hypothetical protein
MGAVTKTEAREATDLKNGATEPTKNTEKIWLVTTRPPCAAGARAERQRAEPRNTVDRSVKLRWLRCSVSKSVFSQELRDLELRYLEL